MLFSMLLGAFLLVFIFCLCIVQFNLFRGIVAQPSPRSLHQYPISRAGGLAMFLGFLVGFIGIKAALNLVSSIKISVFFGLISIILVSFQDDAIQVSPKWRIVIHLIAVVSFVAAELIPQPFELPWIFIHLPLWLASIFTLLFSVWMINLYNFMDGMDGFAGGMAVIGFATLAWLGHADHEFMSTCLVVAAASAGFLVHNFPPAKIFMGDVGSTMLGFLAAACILWGSKLGLFPFWVGILIFSPFIVDATVTLLKRLLRGERVWEAHRTHYYQRLVLLGWGHRRTVLVEYLLMLACAGSALLAVRLSPRGQIILIMTWALIYPLLMFGVGWLERRRATVSNL